MITRALININCLGCGVAEKILYTHTHLKLHTIEDVFCDILLTRIHE